MEQELITRVKDLLDQYKDNGDIVAYSLSFTSSLDAIHVTANSSGGRYTINVTEGTIKFTESDLSLLDILNAKSLLSFIIKGE